ncbi:MAG: hypothetical protein IH859_02580 [Chloroflexi bacterium]|nr:hypothetical protein [Chloroflexota bacterium]
MVTNTERILIEWPQVLASFIIVGSGFAFAKLFVGVTDYPFSLYWSEGNRMWDYSLSYRSELYDYTVNELSSGINRRMGLGLLYGLPYLLPNVSILGLRLWNALLFSIPYAVFGWVAVAVSRSSLIHWVLFGLWVFIFLNQGPIWSSLVIVALMVALAKRSNLWIALPLLIIAGYYAELSRSTWVFAPSIWIVMIVFAQPSIDNRGLKFYDWMRAVLLGIAGVVGSFVIPQSGILQARLVRFSENVQHLLNQHPLLWDRLLPNNTFGTGILFGLALACLPLIILIIYLVQTGRLKLISVQKFILGFGLASFLGVGLVASVKAGGGTNLHNLDMFLLGMVFLAAIVWESGFGKDVISLLKQSSLVRGTLILIVVVPAFVPMVGAGPLLLPPFDIQESAMDGIQYYVSCAEKHGKILFMDQRQLLTFNYINVDNSVLEYEKKKIMDQALAGNEIYFNSFYTDLEDSKYSLIVTDRQFSRFKEDNKSLAVENNAWVKWVTIPLQNKYEAVASYKLVGVELYMPIVRTFTCP